MKSLSNVTQVLCGHGIASRRASLLDPQDAALSLLDHQTINKSSRESDEIPRRCGDAAHDGGSAHSLDQPARVVDVGSPLGQRCLRTPLGGLKLRNKQRWGCRDGHRGNSGRAWHPDNMNAKNDRHGAD